MPYKSGYWGEQAKARSKKRLDYFKRYEASKKLTKRLTIGNYKSPVHIGAKGEEIAMKYLKDCSLIKAHDFDILWKGSKVEVKTSSFLYDKSHGWYYSFDIGIQKGKTDYFMFVCLDEEGKNLKTMYFVPDDAVTSKKEVKIYQNSKGYSDYEVRISRWKKWSN
jgi:hypothetical protein